MLKDFYTTSQSRLDFEYLLLKDIQNPRLKKYIEIYEKEKAIRDDLEIVGIRIFSIWDFVNTTESYLEAVPVLYRHLMQNNYEYRTREVLMRALTVKEAKGIGVAPFVREFIWAINADLNEVLRTDYIAVAARAISELIVKGEADKIMPIFDMFDLAKINPLSKERILSHLSKAYKRAGGK